MWKVVSAIVTDYKAHKMMVVESQKYPALTLPGGKIEPNETSVIALRREIKEELGVNIRILNFYGEFEGPGARTSVPHHAMIYECAVMAGEPLPCKEIKRILWVGRGDDELIGKLSPITRQVFDRLVADGRL